MKVAIFGATGATGRLVVEQALAEDHTVTAFARNPEAVTTKHLRLSIIQGDVFQPADVQQAVEGQDAIICTIGGHDAFRRSSQTSQQGLCTIGTKHILDAMEQSNVARFICLSSWGVGDSKERIPFLFARIIFPLMMKAEVLFAVAHLSCRRCRFPRETAYRYDISAKVSRDRLLRVMCDC